MGSKVKNAPLAEINGAEKFELTYVEIDQIGDACNTLKDFVHLSLSNCRKLHKNFRISSELLKEIQEDGQLLNDRRTELHKLKSDPAVTDESKAEVDVLLEALTESVKEFNVKIYDVFLHKIPQAEFPEEREKYGKKTLPGNPQMGQPAREVEYVSAYLELLGTVITETE